jgi:hypothetical protein
MTPAQAPTAANGDEITRMSLNMITTIPFVQDHIFL